MRSVLLFLFCLALVSCSARVEQPANIAAPVDERATELSKRKKMLERFFQPMRVRDGDWLESQVEDGETFEQYIASNPTLPTEQRKTIYIQPAGKFTSEQLDVIRLTADYMRAFFNLPVTLRETMPLENIPSEMTREVFQGNRQVRTTYFIDTLLPDLLPDDAAAFICLTNYDLFPGGEWNFVFGQASLDRRVGVWSLWRLGQDQGKPASRDLLLARTLKIAVHETGHMFSMRHCTKYECLMSGTNHLDETDRRPIDTCPECSAKIAWAMNYPLDQRFKNLAEFWRKAGRPSEEQLMLEKAEATCECIPTR